MTGSIDAILTPPILFFILGFAAQFVRTDLKLPDALSKFFSIYLLVVIGFEGGVKIVGSSFEWHLVLLIATGVVFALLHPILSYFLVRKKLDRETAVALSASYGSVSLVTFIAALAFLENLGVSSSPQFIAVLAVMESPAILVGVVIHGIVSSNRGREAGWKKKLVHEAVFGPAPLILIGSFAIGMITGESGDLQLELFTEGLFKGFLSLYLLDLGAKASAQYLKSRLEIFHFAYGIGFPIFKGLLGCLIAVFLLDLSQGDALLLAILFASASYIAVPAAMQNILPKANQGVYVTLPLAVTFPFNVLVGIPLYYAILGWLQ